MDGFESCLKPQTRNINLATGNRNWVCLIKNWELISYVVTTFEAFSPSFSHSNSVKVFRSLVAAAVLVYFVYVHSSTEQQLADCLHSKLNEQNRALTLSWQSCVSSAMDGSEY